MSTRVKRIVLAAIAALLLGLGAALPAQAQVPGHNGLLAFSSTRDGNAQIYAATSTGATVNRLTDNEANDTDPAFSPDGSKIAFVSDRDGDKEVYVMNADGSGQTRITNHVGDDMDPAWSPDGSKLAIRRNVDGDNEVFLIDAADGGNAVDLTNNPASDFEPEFSPDGSKIVFQRYTSGSGVGFGNELFAMNADGTGQVNLTDNDNSVNDGRPSFSPDGTVIAFDSNRNDSRFELYTMKPDGTDVTRVTNESGNKQNVAFSPDGNRLAFGGGSGLDGIGIVAAEGGASTLITSDVDSKPDWQVDTTAPVTAITGGPADGSTATVRAADFTFGSNEPEATFECRLDSESGDDWAPCSSPQGYTGLADGSHTFTVRATDLGGNAEAGGASRTWQVDATAPAVDLSGRSGTVATDSATVEFTADDANATFECRRDSSDDADWAGCTSPVELTGLAQGTHGFEVRATDQAGNVSEIASLGWTVDTVAPTTTIDAAPDAASTSVKANFEFSADEPDVTFQCRLDSTEPADWADCESPLAYDDLADGDHIFEVRSTDPAGNASAPASHSWTITTVKPVATIVSGPTGTVNSEDATFEFSADNPNATFQCRLDSEDPGDWAACDSPHDLTGLGQGQHTLEVRATEADQGTGPAVSQTWTVDSIAPAVTIDQSPPAVTSSADAGFTFSADDPGATFECRRDSTDDADWASCTSPQDFTGLGEGAHTFEVRATDQVGNVGEVASHSWTIDQTAPTTTIDLAPAAVNNSIRANFEFSADESDVTFECRLDSAEPADWAACESPLNYNDLADGNHTFEVRGTDAAGNVGAVASHDWEVSTVKPIATIDSGPSGPVADSSATFEFSADNANATFQCRLDSDDPADWAACTTPATFDDLADGDHTFEVRATEIDQGTGPAASQGWTVDTVTPTVELTGTPAPISGTADPEFAFTASEEGTTAECRLDPADETDPWAACSSPVSYTGLTEGEHHFEVRVTDAVGHISEPATYDWTVETTPPPVTITSDPPEDPTTFIGASFEFESTNLNAYFECKFDDGAWEVCESPFAVDQLVDGEHTFSVRAVGHGAGPGPEQSLSWHVDTTVPTVRITANPQAVTTRTDAEFGFEANKPGFTFQCSIDGAAPTACTSPESATGLAAGDHTFQVDALDQADQVIDSASYDWTILADEPEVTITDTPASLSGSSTAAFRFSTDQAAAGFECQLDDGAWQACTSPAAFTGLADGSHTVRVRTTLPDPPASPIYGPVADFTWQVDTTAPAVRITGGPSGTVTTAAATFQITSDDNSATTECSIDGGAWVACDGELVISDLGNGDHQLRVRSVDQAGNTGADHREWSVDSAAPAITLTETPDASTTERSARFDFSADKAGVVFECRLDGGEWASCSPVYTVDGLELGTHQFEVRATDQHGNIGQAVTFGWDVVKPPVKGLVPTVKFNQKIKLDRSGSATLARINCPEGSCRVIAPKRVTFKVKGKKGTPGIKVIRTEFSGRTDVTLISSSRVRKLVAQHGPVKVKVKVKVVSDNGKSRTVTKSVKLTAKK